MTSKAATVEEYLSSLPPDRRAALESVRATILGNLDSGFEEGMQYGMIGYYVPHRVYPAGYHCDPKQPLPFMGLAAQKGHMSLYMYGLYSNPQEQAWLEGEWARTDKKLDMGKACIRFKKLEDLPLPLIGKAVKRGTVKKCIAAAEAMLAARKKKG